MIRIKVQEFRHLLRLQKKWQLCFIPDSGEDRMCMQKEMKRRTRERLAILHNVITFGKKYALKNIGKKLIVNAIFDSENYCEVYRKDLLQADKNIIISSPVISGARAYELISLLHDKQLAGV